MIDVDNLADLSITEVKEAAERLSILKGWNINSVKGALSCLFLVVQHTEALGKIRDLTGAEKQSLAVAIILKLVKLPWWLPKDWARPLLEGVVNAIVEAGKGRL